MSVTIQTDVLRDHSSRLAKGTTCRRTWAVTQATLFTRQLQVTGRSERVLEDHRGFDGGLDRWSQTTWPSRKECEHPNHRDVPHSGKEAIRQAQVQSLVSETEG